MENTPNYELNIFQDTDKFNKDFLNENFNKLDDAISDIQETVNNAGTGTLLITQEVIQARGDNNKLHERLDNIDKIELPKINSSLETKMVSDLDFIDYNAPNYGLMKSHQLITEAYNGNEEIQYFMIGDSFRNSNGNHIYEEVSQKLSNLGVTTYLIGHSGLSLSNWSEMTYHETQSKVSEVIPLISGDGSNTIVDISLGANDSELAPTVEKLSDCFRKAINKIKETKPNTTFILTSPHKFNATPYGHRDNIISAYKKIIVENKGNIGFINVYDNVFPKYNNDIILQYTTDYWHPLEIGQRKIAEYIISKLIPNNLENGVKILKGSISEYDSNYELLKDCGLSVEIKENNNNYSGELYLKFYKPLDKWYFSKDGGNLLNNITGDIKIKNGEQMYTNIFDGTNHYNIVLNFKDCSILKAFEKTLSNTTSIKIDNGVVKDISKTYNANGVLQENTKKIIEIEKKYRFFRGKLDNTHINYNKVNRLVFKINLDIKMENSTTPNLYLKYNSISKRWYIMAGESESSIGYLYLLKYPPFDEESECNYQEIEGTGSVGGISCFWRGQIEVSGDTSQLYWELENRDEDMTIPIVDWSMEKQEELDFKGHINNLYDLILKNN